MNALMPLQLAALLLWGFATGQIVLGVLLASVRLLAGMSGVRLNLTDRQIQRVADLSLLSAALIILGWLAARGLPGGLLAGVSWLPAALFLLLLTEVLNQTPLRWRHLAVTLRRSLHRDANQVVRLGPAYLAMTLLAASVPASEASAWFYWVMAAIIGVWIFKPPPPGVRLRGWLTFVLGAGIALGAGHLTSLGLQQGQTMLENWAIDVLSSADDDPFQSQTRIGDLGRIKLSSRIAWRVEPANPAVMPMLLRTGVFSRYVQGEWLAQTRSFAPLLPSPMAGPASLVLHGESRKGAALLPVPMDVSRITLAAGSLERNAYGVVRVSDAPATLAVSLWQASTARLDRPNAADLALPPGFNKLLERLPELESLKLGSERARLAGLQSWFAGNFRYTLLLGDGRDLERFLLQDRAGHCEYFATSSVLLLRSLGIAARYVTGYSVQEYSPLEKTFLARQRHAHAWAEAFVGGRWIEVDNTPSTWLLAEEDGAPFWQPLADLASFVWHRLTQFQRELDQTQTPAWLAGAAAAALLGWLVWLVWRRVYHSKGSPGPVVDGQIGMDRGNPDEFAALRAIEQEWAAFGLGRSSSEPLRAWLLRVAREGASVLDKGRLAEARTMIEVLYVRRYGCTPASLKGSQASGS